MARLPQVREGTGSAVFDLKYSCICLKPFKGEVLDVVVTSVNKVGPVALPLLGLLRDGLGAGREVMPWLLPHCSLPTAPCV